jgi:hypothetical protein
MGTLAAEDLLRLRTAFPAPLPWDHLRGRYELYIVHHPSNALLAPVVGADGITPLVLLEQDAHYSVHRQSTRRHYVFIREWYMRTILDINERVWDGSKSPLWLRELSTDDIASMIAWRSGHGV